MPPAPPPPPPPSSPPPATPPPSRDRHGQLGRRGEELALAHYRRLGFALLERNYRTRWGELDLVLRDDAVLVFAEVKTGRVGASVSPLDRLHGDKQRRVRMMARSWLHERGGEHRGPYSTRARRLRFDAVGVIVDARDRLVALEHLEGAF